MEITKRAYDGDVMVLTVDGEVDAHTAPELKGALTILLDAGHGRIVVDVSEMTFISSAGLRAILHAHRQAVERGSQIKLVGPTEQVRRVFEIVGLFDLLEIADELDGALQEW